MIIAPKTIPVRIFPTCMPVLLSPLNKMSKSPASADRENDPEVFRAKKKATKDAFSDYTEKSRPSWPMSFMSCLCV
jgi:hypothetical protein